MPILEVNNLSMRFGGLWAVNDLSFYVEEQEVVGLIGPNGSGKTTTINCIAGFYHPVTGEVLLRQRDITGMEPHRIAALGLSRTFQLTNLFGRCTVLDSVMTGMHLKLRPNLWDALWPQKGNKTEKRAKEMAMNILDFVGMVSEKDELSQNITNYSRKRLGLAVALATNPCMLLIDELVSGLSAEETKGIIDQIQKIRKSGVSILLVEHNMRVIMSVCDRISVLNFGTKLTEGSPQEVVRNEAVQKAYLGGRHDA